jgi:hypothetical protein
VVVAKSDQQVTLRELGTRHDWFCGKIEHFRVNGKTIARVQVDVLWCVLRSWMCARCRDLGSMDFSVIVYAARCYNL